MILKNSSKLIEIDENLMKSTHFVSRVINSTSKTIIDIDAPKSNQNNLVTESLVFMRFSSISINLLEFFRIMSFVFDLKYLSQNSINFNMLGVFWNPQDEQFPKLSLDLHFEQHLKEILRVLHWCRCWLPPLYFLSSALLCMYL